MNGKAILGEVNKMANEIIAKNIEDAKEQLRKDNAIYKRSGILTRIILDSVDFHRTVIMDNKPVKVYTFKVKILSKHPKHHL